MKKSISKQLTAYCLQLLKAVSCMLLAVSLFGCGQTSSTPSPTPSPSGAYSISGNILVQIGGLDATVTLSGDSSNTTTSIATSGAYSFTSLSAGTYTITPSKSGYLFYPSSLAVTIESSNIADKNFTASIEASSFKLTFNKYDLNTGNTDIWITNLDGTGRTKLTDNKNSVSPVFSSDKSKILYSFQIFSGLTPTSEIYIINSDGSGIKNLTNSNIYFNNEPAFALNNTKVIYANDSSGKTEIYSMNTDGTHPIALTTFASDEWGPVVFPNGSECLFTTSYNHPTANYYNIYKMGIDGSNKTNLTSGTSTNNYCPTISGDGTRISYSAYSNESLTKGDVYVMNSDGSTKVNISGDSNKLAKNPGLSYDGSKVAFESDRSGASEIYIANSDGSGLERLTNTTDLDPTKTNVKSQFLRDGRILFISKRDDKAQIYVMNADGSNQSRVSDNTADDNSIYGFDKPSF